MSGNRVATREHERRPGSVPVALREQHHDSAADDLGLRPVAMTVPLAGSLRGPSAAAAPGEPGGIPEVMRRSADQKGAEDSGSVGRAVPDIADPFGGTAAPPEITDALRRRRGGGKPLNERDSQRFAAGLGTDLSGVRVHTDPEADEIARSVQAKAFTHGSDIYFTQGTFSPGTGDGDHLLAHELAHVAQGSSGTSSAGGPTIGKADDPAEADADKIADSVTEGSAAQDIRRSGRGVATTCADPSATRPEHHPSGLRQGQEDGKGTVRQGEAGGRRQDRQRLHRRQVSRGEARTQPALPRLRPG